MKGCPHHSITQLQPVNPPKKSTEDGQKHATNRVWSDTKIPQNRLVSCRSNNKAIPGLKKLEVKQVPVWLQKSLFRNNKIFVWDSQLLLILNALFTEYVKISSIFAKPPKNRLKTGSTNTQNRREGVQIIYKLDWSRAKIKYTKHFKSTGG